MKWEEIDYFLEFINKNSLDKKNISILDIWCWNWRLIDVIENNNLKVDNYLWVDLSKWLLEEAKKLHNNYKFLKNDMLDLYKIKEKFDFIFFIASFHHLKNIEERKKVIEYSKKLLKTDWIIFMTNWSLNSEINYEKYKNSIISESDNKFLSLDYNIKIWEFARFYHCFDLSELEYLFKNSNLEIIENRLFDNKKNYISILKQKK